MSETTSQLSAIDTQPRAELENVPSTSVKPEQLNLEPQQEPRPLKVTKHSREQMRQKQQEVRTLADSIVPEQKTSATPAQRESIFDEQGRIIDVRFTKGDNTRTLKELLPGSYTIHFYQNERQDDYAGYADPIEDVIHVNNSRRKIETDNTDPFFVKEHVIPVSESDINHVLLHEAAHMVDDQNNLTIYQQLETERDKAQIQGYLLLANQLEVMESVNSPSLNKQIILIRVKNLLHLEFPDEKFTQDDIADGNKAGVKILEACNKRLEQDRRWLTQQQFDKVHQAFEDMKRYSAEHHPFEELDRRLTEANATETKFTAKLHALQERNAEALGLRAHRELERQGITVFAGVTYGCQVGTIPVQNPAPFSTKVRQKLS